MLADILTVFTEIFTWIREAMIGVVDVFYDPATSELTFFGILGIAALGISIFFLLMRVVQNFLHFRS